MGDLKLGGETKMNAIPFGARNCPGIGSDQARQDQPVDAAWIVLEAANDLGDHATVEVCRRVIDASLKGTLAAPPDLHVVVEYFR
jgi:hypothetical protein